MRPRRHGLTERRVLDAKYNLSQSKVFVRIGVWFPVLYHVQQVPSVSLCTENKAVVLASESVVTGCVGHSRQMVVRLEILLW
jgi:hypothetical protein